jgi:hypothetical protein
MGAVELGALVFSWSLWAVLFWGSIRILEPNNANNTFGKALAVGALYVVCTLFVHALSYIGLVLAVAWLVFLLRLLVGWYELGILKSLGVVAGVNVTPYFLVPWLYELAGGSLIVLFVGFPAAVIAVWLIRRKRMSLPSLPRAKAKVVAKSDATAPAPVVRAPIEPPPPPPPPGDKPRLLT